MRVSHAPRGLTVCPGMASGVAGRHTKGEAPGALAPSPVTGSACRDLSRQAPDPPISLRRQCACGSFHRANREGSHTPSPRQRDLLAGALSRPPHPTATPASAPDILSSDAFQDLPSSGAGVISHGIRGGGWSGYACPTGVGANPVVKRGVFVPPSPVLGCWILRDL